MAGRYCNLTNKWTMLVLELPLEDSRLVPTVTSCPAFLNKLFALGKSSTQSIINYSLNSSLLGIVKDTNIDGEVRKLGRGCCLRSSFIIFISLWRANNKTQFGQVAANNQKNKVINTKTQLTSKGYKA